MELKYVDASKMKTLEDYAIALITGMLSLKTLETFHARVIDLGLLKEDQECRANTVIWDIKRLLKLYNDQATSVLELLPDTFSADNIVESLRKAELTKARQMTRKHKAKKS